MRLVRILPIGALLAATLAFAGPPWISIEIPPNPYDAASRNAFLLVHSFHHGTPAQFPVFGTAEGLVNGARRTVSLEFRRTSRPGVYALNKQWPDDGVWTLVLGVRQNDGHGDGNVAQAVVELASSGEVASVRVPTRRQSGIAIPLAVSMAEVEDGLRARSARSSR